MTPTIIPRADLGLPARVTGITSAIPFTWTSGCTVLLSGRYRMTTRYS
jgi:hypothetical protein